MLRFLLWLGYVWPKTLLEFSLWYNWLHQSQGWSKYIGQTLSDSDCYWKFPMVVLTKHHWNPLPRGFPPKATAQMYQQTLHIPMWTRPTSQVKTRPKLTWWWSADSWFIGSGAWRVGDCGMELLGDKMIKGLRNLGFWGIGGFVDWGIWGFGN